MKIGNKGEYTIESIGEHIIHVVFSKKDKVKKESVMIEPQAMKEVLIPSIEEHKSIFKTKKIRLEIDTKGICTWYNQETQDKLLQEREKSLVLKDVMGYEIEGDEPIINRVATVDGERNFVENMKEVMKGQAYRGKINFEFDQEEKIFGLGQNEEGIYNYRGSNQYLYQHNMRIPMPFFVSNKNYGLLVDCCSLMTFEDNHNGSYLFMDTVEQIDYYFIIGENMDDIIRGFRNLTGRAQMLPKWAFGYVQSKETYRNQEELVDIIAEYRKREVPIDCVVQDWKSWIPGNWGEKILDKTRFPNMKEAAKQIHDMNAHAIVSVWPNMNHTDENYKEMMDAGHILLDFSTYNAFDEDARKLYWDQMNRELFSGGFDGWWCDSTEPFSGPDWNGVEKREPWERFTMVGNEHKKYLDPAYANAFATLHAKGIYENQRKTTEEKRVFNLTRSGYPSIQKYGTMLWSGDITATWDTMQVQLKEGLNMAMSGIPFWTLDIGGFFVLKENWTKRGADCHNDPSMKWFWQGDYEEGISDLAYRELYTRWIQFGTFLPMFRSHGTDTPREIWNFGEKGEMFYDTIEKFINLRYTLMPYIYSLVANVCFNDSTMMRSLLFDFAHDEKAVDIWNQFMFGPSLLICPVMEPMYYDIGSVEITDKKKTRVCYLPEGEIWYDYWTNEKYDGGQEIEVETTLDKMPIFVRGGSIIPVSEGIQYATERVEVQKVYVYPGKDCTFTMYEDEGDSYRFEQGEFATTKMNWNDGLRALTIEPRQGEYRGMVEEVEYEIIIIES